MYCAPQSRGVLYKYTEHSSGVTQIYKGSKHYGKNKNNQIEQKRSVK